MLVSKGLSIGVGDEGGFAPKIGTNKKAMRVLVQSIEKAGFKLKKDFALGIDAAASEFFDADKEIYRLSADHKNFKPSSVYKLYAKWIADFGLKIIEDGCAEDDFKAGSLSRGERLAKYNRLMAIELELKGKR